MEAEWATFLTPTRRSTLSKAALNAGTVILSTFVVGVVLVRGFGWLFVTGIALYAVSLWFAVWIEPGGSDATADK